MNLQLNLGVKASPATADMKKQRLNIGHEAMSIEFDETFLDYLLGKHTAGQPTSNKDL